MRQKSPNPVDKHVGNRVRMRRMMLKMSQEKLADGLGITFQQVQKYEKGSNRIGASRLQHIATILDVEPSFFFEDAPQTSDTARGVDADLIGVDRFLTSTDGLSLIKAFSQIKEAKIRRGIADLAQDIAEALRTKKG